ncbi:Antiviral helicase SKI2 [Bienertia sinuspersici]
MAEGVTLKFWHGCVFKEDLGGVLRYVGGKGKTFEVDPDHLCWWFLKELAESCGEYGEIQSIYYLNPSNSLAHGFTKVYDDEEVRRMGEVASKFRSVELYVSHGSGAELGAQISPTEVHSQRPKKLTPKTAPQLPTRKNPNKKESCIESNTKDLTPTEPASTEVPLFTLNQINQAGLDSENQINVTTPTTSKYDKFVSLIQTRINTLSGDNLQVNHESHVTTTTVPEGYEWEDNRPDSPIPWQDLLGPYSSSEGSDSDFEPTDAESDDDSSINDEVEEEELFEVGESEGGVEGDDEDVETSDEEYHILREKVKEGHLSDCYDSDEDINTPSDNDEDDTGQHRRLRQKLWVPANTDFSVFQWKVEQKFATRKDFKQAVAKYGIAQGRNVGFKISDKGRQQRLGVDCAGGCPFRLYASWDTRRATFVLKTVKGEHTCVRNMERNKQLRTGWIAEQLLEVFKSRPHWPVKDIIECIKLRYRMMVKKAFAYKVKYRAHRLLHGSMKDHYNKVGQYLQAIKDSTYGGAIPPIEGERHWSGVLLPLDPPPIKIGPGRRRKKRIKDPYENPKKPGKLTKHGIEMTCQKCKRKGHNKRKCPNNAITEEPQAQPKRPRGRSKKNACSHPQTVPDISSQVHHDTTAEPTRLGRGGRVIRGGRGGNSGRGGSSASTAGVSSGGVTNSRGGSSGAPRGRGGNSGAPRGRGGRGKSVQPSPQGQGVLFAADGSVMINAPGTSGGPKVMETQMRDFTKG